MAKSLEYRDLCSIDRTAERRAA